MQSTNAISDNRYALKESEYYFIKHDGRQPPHYLNDSRRLHYIVIMMINTYTYYIIIFVRTIIIYRVIF